MILVDTDVMVDILRGHAPAMAWLGDLDDEQIVLSGFVVAELLQGCRNRKEQQKVERVIAPHLTAWPSSGTCDRALCVFSEWYLSHGLGIIDALIGQWAADMGEVLYTFNDKHYACIDGLVTKPPYNR